MCRVIIGMLLFCSSMLFAQNDDEMVFFETGRARLTKGHKAKIDAILSKLDKKEVYDLSIKGFSDSYGGHHVNRKLSKLRVDHVFNYIISYGFKFEHVELLPYGETKSDEDYTHHTQSQYDRRVEFHVTRLGETIKYSRAIPVNDIYKSIAHSKPSTTYKNVEKPLIKTVSNKKKSSLRPVATSSYTSGASISDLYKQMAFKTQTFYVRSESNMFLKCREGSVLYIPKGAFDTEERKIKVLLRENITPSETVFQSFTDDIYITNDYDIKESFYIKAYNSVGEEVQVKEGVRLSLMIPTEEIDKEIKLVSLGDYADEALHSRKISDFQIKDYVEFDREGDIDLSSKKMKSEFKEAGKYHNPVIEEVVAYGDSIVFGEVYLESIKKTSSQILKSAFDVYHFEKASQFLDRKNVPLLKRLRVLYPNLRKHRMHYEDISHFEHLRRNGKEIRYDSLHYYSLEIDKQGWIFLGDEKQVKGNTREVVVKLKPHKNMDVKLVSKKYKKVLFPSAITKDGYIFKDVPEKADYEIFAVRFKNLEDHNVEQSIIKLQKDKNEYTPEFKKVAKVTMNLSLKRYDHHEI